MESRLPDMPEREGWGFRAWEMIKAVLSAPKGLPLSAFQREHQRGLTASLPPTSTLQGLCQDARSSNQSPGKVAAAFPAFLTSTVPGSVPGLPCALPIWWQWSGWWTTRRTLEMPWRDHDWGTPLDIQGHLDLSCGIWGPTGGWAASQLPTAQSHHFGWWALAWKLCPQQRLQVSSNTSRRWNTGSSL